MLERVLVVGGIAALCSIFILLQTTSPSSVGPLGILALFVLIYTLSVCLITPTMLLLWKIKRQFLVRKRSSVSISLRKAYYYASILALMPTVLLAIGTVGQIGFYDMLLVVFFVIIACIYISKRTT